MRYDASEQLSGSRGDNARDRSAIADDLPRRQKYLSIGKIGSVDWAALLIGQTGLLGLRISLRSQIRRQMA
jgi:hypothetical protein